MKDIQQITKIISSVIASLSITTSIYAAAPNAQTPAVNCYKINLENQCNQSYQSFCMQYDTVDNSQAGCSKWGLIQCQWVENVEGTQTSTWCVPVGKSYAMKKSQGKHH